MKKIIFFLILLSLASQCSEPQVNQNISQKSLSQEDITYIQNVSKRLVILGSFNAFKNGQKMLFDKITMLSLINDIGRSVYNDDNDKNGKKAFDYLLNSEEMQKLITWASEFSKRQGSRLHDSEYNPEDLLSASAKSQVATLKSAMTNCINSYYYETDYLLNVLLNGIINSFQSDLANSTSISLNDLNSLYTASEALRATIPDTIATARYYAEIEEAKTQVNWSRFKNKLVSILTVTVVCGLAGVLIGLTVGLAAPVTISLIGWQVAMQTAGAVIGASAGVIIGTGMAASDICFETDGGWGTYPC